MKTEATEKNRGGTRDGGAREDPWAVPERMNRPKLLWPCVLFVLTVASTLYAGAYMSSGWDKPVGSNIVDPFATVATLVSQRHFARALTVVVQGLATGWSFAVPLMVILLFHEFGHWTVARRNRVETSLPMFIPFPNLVGTMGAVIFMPKRVRSRDALVDISAAGPLAGMFIAVPTMVVGLMLSRFGPAAPKAGMSLIEGDSILYLAMKYLVVGTPPPGQVLWLHPTAFAAWTGFLVTLLNLLPVSQLDGGHVAYAFFGRRFDRWSRYPIAALAVLGAGISLWVIATTPRKLLGLGAFSPALTWLLWALFSAVVIRLSGGEHPPTDPGPLSPSRRAIAVVCFVLFVLLFMPLPIRNG